MMFVWFFGVVELMLEFYDLFYFWGYGVLVWLYFEDV